MSRFACGFPRVALGNSAGSRRCCVTSPGSRVGITELMLGLRCDESVVTLLVLRCYGFGTVLDFFRWLVSRRESSGPASRSTLRTLEGEARESRSTRRERVARWRVVLNSPIWTPPTGGWSNQSVCMGRSPAHVHGFYPRYTFM